LKIKEFKGFRCKYGLNLRVEFPVFFVLDLFLGEMGRGYGKLPLEDNRVCPWTEMGFKKLVFMRIPSKFV